MSLINNMLKDLEKRKFHQPEGTVIPLVSATHRLPRLSSRMKIFILSSLISFLVLLPFVTLLMKKPAQKSLTLSPSVATTRPAPIATTNDQRWLNAAIINGITVQTKENITELSFLLDHAALYHLQSDEMHNQLILSFDNVQLRAEVPPVGALGTALQTLSAKQNNSQTQFRFSLNQGASIKYVNLIDEDKNPQLVLGLESGPTAGSHLTSTASPVVKTPAMESLLTQQYHDALIEAEKSHYQLAIDKLTAVVQMDPGYVQARISLAALLMDRGALSRASQLINDGLTTNSDSLPLIELNARILTMQGKIKQALNMLQASSPAIEDNPDYHAFMAALYERNNNDLFAVRIYKQLLTLNPSNGSWWFGLGISLDKLKQPQSALEAYTKAMAEGHLTADASNYLLKRMKTLQQERSHATD